jgi:hypothetical protein
VAGESVSSATRALAHAMHDWSPWFRLILCVLATWRVSHLVASEDGPFDMIVRLRARAGDGMLGRLMDCPYCLSLWIAAPAALLLGRSFPEWCAAWLAISGGASLLEKRSRSISHGDHEDVMLRTETRNDGDTGDTEDAEPAPGARPFSSWRT